MDAKTILDEFRPGFDGYGLDRLFEASKYSNGSTAENIMEQFIRSSYHVAKPIIRGAIYGMIAGGIISSAIRIGTSGEYALALKGYIPMMLFGSGIDSTMYSLRIIHRVMDPTYKSPDFAGRYRAYESEYVDAEEWFDQLEDNNPKSDQS